LPWKMLVSMIGLSTACVVLYAQANVMEQNSVVKAPATPAAPPAPKSPPAPPAPPAPVSISAPSAEPRPQKASKKENGDFALIKIINANSTTITSNGSFDQNEIAMLKGKSKDETLWFRDNGTLYAIRDQATLNKVHQAYQPMEEVGKKMDAKGKEMDAYGKVMEKIGKEMEVVNAQNGQTMRFESKEGKEFEKNLELEIDKIEQLKAEMKNAKNDNEREELHQKISQIQKKMPSLITKVMDAESKKLNEMHNSNVSLNKQMSEASKPMDKLGKEMGQLGKQMGQLSKQADNEVRELIQAAKQKGLVTPLEKI
jgi:hypothetical protein